MSLFIDKYYPTNQSDLAFNKDVFDKCKNLYYKLSDDVDFSCVEKDVSYTYLGHNIILSGDIGSGKKVIANLLAKNISNSTKIDLGEIRRSKEIISIKYQTKQIEFNYLSDNQHYFINPSKMGVYDKLVLLGFMKEVISKYKIATIIINDADKLTLDANFSLKILLEKYTNSKFILIARSPLKLIGSLLNMCIEIRLKSPSNDELEKLLRNICNKEQIAIDTVNMNYILNNSQRNVKKAINLLQLLSTLNSGKLVDNTEKYVNDEVIYHNIAGIILSPQNNVKFIKIIREQLFILLVHCFEPIDIVKHIVNKILDKLKLSDKLSEDNEDIKRKKEIYKLLSNFDQNCKRGNKPIYHIEAFIVDIYRLLNY